MFLKGICLARVSHWIHLFDPTVCRKVNQEDDEAAFV